MTMPDDEKPMTSGELKLSDLPPIEELTISVEESNLVKVGHILSVVDVLVVVESDRAMPPLDLDSILFDALGKPIGRVFDVFGPISNPHYSIRFNTCQQIVDKGLTIGEKVFFVPHSDRKITKFAFVTEIQKIKGTDASWEDDNEPPGSVVEYSDDEEEKLTKREARKSKMAEKQPQLKSNQAQDPS